MPNKLRQLSGKEVIAFCASHGMHVISTKGSHVNLGRYAEDGRKEFVTTVPDHKELDRGMAHNIFKRLRQFISESELRTFFYTADR